MPSATVNSSFVDHAPNKPLQSLPKAEVTLKKDDSSSKARSTSMSSPITRLFSKAGQEALQNPYMHASKAKNADYESDATSGKKDALKGRAITPLFTGGSRQANLSNSKPQLDHQKISSTQSPKGASRPADSMSTNSKARKPESKEAQIRPVLEGRRHQRNNMDVLGSPKQQRPELLQSSGSNARARGVSVTMQAPGGSKSMQ